MKKIAGCLFWAVMVSAGLWVLLCLIANVAYYGKLLPGLGW